MFEEVAREESARVVGGAVLVMAAAAVPLSGLVSFAVDLGMVTLTSNQLQASGDAAALAGGSALIDGGRRS